MKTARERELSARSARPAGSGAPAVLRSWTMHVQPRRTAICVVVLLGPAGCAGQSQAPRAARTERAETELNPTPAGRWVVHGFAQGPLDAEGAAVTAFVATFIGAEGIGESIALPSAAIVRWSPDGKWLAFCGSEANSSASGAGRHAKLIRFDGQRVSAPIAAGECRNLEWAPHDQRLLIQGEREWRLLDVGGAETKSHSLGAEFVGPVVWSASGDYFFATERGSSMLRLADLTRLTAGTQRLDAFGSAPKLCSWASEDILACDIERAGKRELAIVNARTPGSAPDFAHALEGSSPLRWLGFASDALAVYDLGEEHGVYVWPRAGSTATQLFVPDPGETTDYYRLSPAGPWLLQCMKGGVRIWDLLATPRELPLPELSGTLVNPRWSPNGQHALVGVRHLRDRSMQTDVWLMADARRASQWRRVAKLGPGKASFARFSPGSQWVLVDVHSDTPLPPAEGAKVSSRSGAEASESFAVHIATGVQRDLNGSFGEWAPDDTAFVYFDTTREHLLARRVRETTFTKPDVLGDVQHGALELAWQP